MKLPDRFRDNRGFTAIELLIVIALMMILLAAATPLYGNLHATASLNEGSSLMVQALQEARAKSIAQYNTSTHGVFFNINPDGADSYILYQGASYATRDRTFDVVFEFDDIVQIDTTLVGDEVKFSKGLGKPDVIGDILLQHGRTAEQRIVEVSASGAVFLR